MDELEQRLRSALTAMAEEVPPSRHPWAEHQRRLADGRSRRPWLMMAVAAGVVALIAVPVVVLKMRPDPVQAADGTPPPTSQLTTSQESSTISKLPTEGVYEPQPGETVLTQPVAVTYEGSGSDNARTLAYTLQRSEGRYLCLVRVVGMQTPVISRATSNSSCALMNPPRVGKVVWTSRFFTTSVASRMLYVASRPTDNILVRTAEGPYAVSYPLAKADDFSLFVVDLVSTKLPAAYTARDKANAILENG